LLGILYVHVYVNVTTGGHLAMLLPGSAADCRGGYCVGARTVQSE